MRVNGDRRRTYLITYLCDLTDLECDVAVRVNTRQELHRFWRKLRVIGYREVTEWDRKLRAVKEATCS